ncbi:uncharacterized protein [Dermacentor albipictus]|uniref:uncharacterized protein isoform X1 n=1 Tax=Dermacentor albipictus TaxID=60249 RepID=UPI0038FD075A
MCLCDTAFSVTVLAVVCLLVHLGNFMVEWQMGLDNAGTITSAILAVVSVIIALILLVGAVSGNKKLVDTFLCLAKIRVLLLIVALFYVSFLYFKFGSDAKGARKSIGTYVFDIILTKLAAKADEGQIKAWLNENKLGARMGQLIVQIITDAFVIYRISIFSDTMGPS